MPVSNTIIDLISYKSNSIEKKKKNDEKVINRQFWYFLGRQAPGGGVNDKYSPKGRRGGTERKRNE